MELLLILTVLLSCIHRGEGHLLHSLIEFQGKANSPQLGDLPDSSNGKERDADFGRRWLARDRREAESPCSLRTLLLQVRDLGLGYDSDEMVVFKYCSGACPLVRSNHDLTLTSLLLRGALPPPLPGEGWHNTPCCRPTHHEDLAFLDNAHRWHKVEQLSAAACTCVG
ncbi:persephin [Scleropages formosus]|uniref:persephin n=1 Tax=Scleropages formosus TaxID=113540 RepID=UPI000878EFE1|nr:persephin [Scleropages formosus]